MTSILVVDDSPTVAYMVQKTLEGVGYIVTTALSAKEALEAIKTIQFDLVLMDIMMPTMDGWEALEKIRLDPKTKNIPALVVSVKEEDVDKEKSFEVKADGHLTKPIIKEELIATIEWVLKNAPRRGY